MTVTPFLKLQKPPFDTIPWDDALNGNMDIIDAFVSQFMSVPNYVGVWTNNTAYVAGQNVLDVTNTLIYTALITHTSATSPTTFPQDRVANPSYWVQTIAGSFPASTYAPSFSPTFTGDPKAPTPAPDDNDTSIATTAFVTAAAAQEAVRSSHNVGRNYIHNPLFNIGQRGNGAWTTSGYGPDRWIVQQVTDTVSFGLAALTDAGRTAIGDEEATIVLNNNFTGNAAAGAYNYIAQRIENVRRLAGKTVTISFWAASAAGTPKLGINVLQSFGTGGSPSASDRALITGNSVTVSATWTRYTTTILIPSIIGKTVGTNGDSYTALEIWYSAGATNNAIAGNIGVQTASINLWGVQLEVGTNATPLEKPDPQYDLANCYRFYFVIFTYVGPAAVYATGVTFPSTMRAAPIVAGGGAGYSALVLNNLGVTHTQTSAAAQNLTFAADL